MKKSVLLSTLTLLFCLLQGALAEAPIQVRFEVLKAPKAPSKRILSISEWSKFAANRENLVLGTLEEVAELGTQALIFDGFKSPLAYRDPRVDGNQVQYIDLGLKLDFTVTRKEGGMLEIVTRGEQSSAAPHPDLPERAGVVIFESETLLKRGQSAVFGHLSGPLMVKHFKSQYPEANFTSEDSVILTISVE